MTTITGTAQPQDYRTVEVVPELMVVFSYSGEVVSQRVWSAPESPADITPEETERHTRAVEDLIAWATDPATFEPGAADRIRREVWGRTGE